MKMALVCMSAALLSASQALATTFYVDATNGSNSNSGATWALAKKSIQAAVNIAASNDIILIAGGSAAEAVYAEQVLVNEKTLTLRGGQDNSSTGADESAFPTVIRPTAMASNYTEATLLGWSGFPSTTFEPVVYGQFSTNSYSLNVYNLTIDGNKLSGNTRMFVGLAIRNGNGTVGSSTERVNVTGVREATMSAFNGCFGILIFGKSQALVQYTTVDDYQTAGILVAGNSTSTLASTIASQPMPAIQDCILKGQNRNNANAYIAGMMSVFGGRGTIIRTITYHNYNTVSSGATPERNSYGYGVYLSDARSWTVGDLTVKGKGNLITENEIGVFAEITVGPTVIPVGLYQIRQNNIYRNGYDGSNSSPSTGMYYDVCGCSYTSTTFGNVRYRNSGTTSSSVLSVQSNAWGNSDAGAMFSKSTPAYTPANYDAAPVAFWQETIGDAISAASPLAGAVTWVDSLAFNESYTPISGINVNFEYGFTQFPSLNDAVAAASSSTKLTITVPVGTHVLDYPLVINKAIVLKGKSACSGGTPASTMAVLQLATGVCGPTVWVQGMSTAAGDPLTRTPDGVEIRDFYIDTRVGGGSAATFNWGLAFTGAYGSGNVDISTSPTNTKVKGVKISTGYTGGLYAMVTRMKPGVADGPCNRVSKGATASNRDIDAKITYYGNCDVTSLSATEVWDDADELAIIARIIYDNTIYVATCAELQAAFDLAAIDPAANTPMNIIVTAAITNCTANYNVNHGGNVTLNTQGLGGIVFDNNYPLNLNSNTSNTGIYTGNEGSYTGGTDTSCNLVNNSSNITVGRVNVWPPACLQKAVDLVTAGNANAVYAANGNGTVNPLSFVESNGKVTLQKNFDLNGGLNSNLNTAGNATFSGYFDIIAETDLDVVNTGVHVAQGTMTSTRGAAFADGSDQVVLHYNSSTNNNGPAGSIDMALQFVNTSSGSRGLSLDNTVVWNQSPGIAKRVHLHGTTGRDAVFNAANTIYLNFGAGDCNNPSLLDHLSIATVRVASDNVCLQSALGTAGADQATQGVGTNATNGSGGTVDLNNVANWTQNMDIAKSVAFSNQGGGTTSGIVNLRRGANVTGGLSNFTNTVNLNQNPSWTSAANPNPNEAITIAQANGTVNVAGYGRGNSIGTGNAAGGPWNFSNISINKALTVQGYYDGTCANTPVNCTAADTSAVPPMTTGRGGSSETVIGFNNGTFTPAAAIFDIAASNVNLYGFYFDNVHGSPTTHVIASNGAGYNNVNISNNIVDASGAYSQEYGLLSLNTAQTRQHWNIECNRMMGSSLGHSGSYVAHFVFWDNNHASTYNGANGSAIRNNVVLTNDGNDQIAIWNMKNASAAHMLIENNYLGTYTGAKFSSTNISLIQTGADNLQGITVQRNVISRRGTGVIVAFCDPYPYNTATAASAPNIDINHNFFYNIDHGVNVRLSGLYTAAASPAWVSIKDNFLGHTWQNGVLVSNVAGTTTGKIDISLNWWAGAANLGPIRGANVSAAVQPFASANGSKIEQDAAGAGDVFTSVLPFYTSATDQILTNCGWDGGPIIGPVLRMATGGTSLLGIYPTITDARDNTNCSSGFSCNPSRTNTDEIWVIGGTGAGAYPSLASPEGGGTGYPVVFNADPQPSLVKGINGAIIRYQGTGALQSTTRNNGFTVADLTFSDAATSTHTVVDLSSGDATINNCVFSSSTGTGEFTAIKVQGTGSNALNIGNVAGNTIAYTGTVNATGIQVVGGFNSGSILNNTITGIYHSNPAAANGAAIYVGPGTSNLMIGSPAAPNTIQGSASNGSNGIVLDGTASTIHVQKNTIATTAALRSTNATGLAAGGFGVLVYASNGASNIGNVNIFNNTIGGATGAGSVDQSGVFVGGTTGTIGDINIGGVTDGNTIRGVRNAVGTAANSDAAISVATFGNSPASGKIHIVGNNIGGTGANEGNKVDLLIGNLTSANNLEVNVRNNNFRDDAQVIETVDYSIRDSRPNAGANIRNIFGYTNGTTNNGANSAGNGNSGYNTFSHAAILTSSTNLQNYSIATVRTADAAAGYTSVYRLAQTPLTNANNTNNTVELRENAGINTNNAASYFNETLTFPDYRCMLLGPTTSAGNVTGNANLHANIYAGTASVDLISTGRENKDVRGGITFHAIGGTAGSVGATGIYGRIPTGDVNKGDVYLQGTNVGADNGFVRFAYHNTTLGSQIEMGGTGAETTGGNNLADRNSGIIKAGLEDANDDAYTITSNQARRTGVFQRGNGTAFTKPNDGPLTGDMTGVFPNPTSGEATLRYAVPASGTVSISIYNALGVKVAEFEPVSKDAGLYSIDISTGSMPAGAYTIRVMNSVQGYATPMTITTPLQVVR